MIAIESATEADRTDHAARTEPRKQRTPRQVRTPAFHQINPTKIVALKAPKEPILLSVFLKDRIKWMRRNHECGAMLFVSDKKALFLVPQNRAGVDTFLSNHAAWFVGLYAADHATPGRRVRCPDSSQLHDDLIQHFADLGIKP